jgi:hypothetical protein
MTLSQKSRAALVVAHPSHELRIHRWLEQTRPRVCILTDGAGRSGEPRLHRTTEVLFRTGATPGPIYGRLTDLEIYAAILNQDSKLFAGIVEELAQMFVDDQIEYVAGDAAEGYSVTHDICRVMIDAAVELAQARYGHSVANFDFPVVGLPDSCPVALRHKAIRLELDDLAFTRKVNAALSYSPKLARDVEAALAGATFQGDVEVSRSVHGALEGRPMLKARLRDIIEGVPLDAFRVECLRPVANPLGSPWTSDQPLFYELYGEKLVAAGRYKEVIRCRKHMLPLAAAIQAEVEREEHCVRSAS